MNREEIVAALNQAFALKYSSLAAYIAAAQPYVREQHAAVLSAIEDIAAEDANLRDRTAAVIEALEGIPRAQPYPEYVSELNYLDIIYLQTVLDKHLIEQRRSV